MPERCDRQPIPALCDLWGGAPTLRQLWPNLPHCRLEVVSMIPMPTPIEVEPQALPVGAAVGSFVLRGVHSRDAFGIRYLATASSSGGEVLIEEFAPAGISLRDATGLLVPLAPEHAALWDEGLQAFLQESQVLGAALHPAIMRVASLWRIRGTAFRMWPRIEGRTLAEVCATMDEPPSEAWRLGLVGPLLDALESLHGAGWVHGNVRPGQILMRSEGGPMLLDTGAVHKTIGARMPQHPAWPEPGFRPPELGDDASGQLPGPWTDLYSLAAVVKFIGQAPGNADDWAASTERPSGTEASRFVVALERALLSDARQRPQSVAVFRQQLLASVATAAVRRPARLPATDPPAPTLAGNEPVDLESEKEPRRDWLEPMHADRPWEEPAFQTPRARRWPKVAAAALGLLMLAAVAAYQFVAGDRAAPKAALAASELPDEQMPARTPPPAGPVQEAAPEPRPVPLPATPLPDPAPALASPPVATEPARVEAAPARPAPAAPVVASAATPAAACAPRTQFALYRCMQTQCEQRRFWTHPQCVQLRLTDEPPG